LARETVYTRLVAAIGGTPYIADTIL